jgi:hypothetical protein
VAGVGQHGITPRIDAVKAVVADVGWVDGLAAIRSFGRAGIPDFAVDHRSSQLGFRSLKPGLVNAARVTRGVVR